MLSHCRRILIANMLGATILLLLALGAASESSTFKSFPVSAISEVVFEGGSAGATSIHRAPWTPDKAFSRGHSHAWHNANEAADRVFPDIVWYEFPAGKSFVPGRVSFRGRQDCCLNQTPTVWQFVGSNDESCGKYGNWSILCGDNSNAAYPNKFWTKYCDVDDKITTAFRCLGIMVLNTHEDKNGAASLRDVRMWKKVYQS